MRVIKLKVQLDQLLQKHQKERDQALHGDFFQEDETQQILRIKLFRYIPLALSLAIF